MKTKIVILFLFILFIKPANAQPDCKYFSSGASGVWPYNTLAVGAPAPVWMVSGPPAGPQLGVVVNPCNGSCINNITGAAGRMWISYPFNCVPGNKSDHSCFAGPMDLYYTTNFNVPANTPYNIDWIVYANDWVQDIKINGQPVYTSPINQCANHPLDINVGIIVKWCTWNAGNNVISIHTVSQPMSNPPPCNGYDNCAGLVVEAGCTPTTPMSGNLFPCQNSTNVYSIPLVVMGTPTVPMTYSWTTPSGWSGGGTSPSPTLSTTASLNSGIVNVMATSSNGLNPPFCWTTGQLSVTVLPQPTVTANTSTSQVCPGRTVTLTGSGTAISYSWRPVVSLPAGSPLTVVTVTPALANTVYTVIGTAANGCTNSANVNVSLLTPPTIFITPAPSFVCANMANTLTASGGVSYTWTSPSSGNSTNPWAVSVTPPQTFTVFGTGPNTCTNSISLSLSAGSIIPVSTSNATLCTDVGPCVTIGANSTFTSWPPTYTWNPWAIPGQTLSVCPVISTVYTVTAQSPILCPNTATMAVTVQTCCPPADPAIVFSIQASPLCNLTLTNLAQYAYVNGSGGGTTTIAGTFSGTGVSFSGGQYYFNQSQSLSAGNYSIAFTYTTAPWGCSYTLIDWVTVLPPLTAYALPAYRCAYSSNPAVLFGDMLPNQPAPFFPWPYPLTYSWSPGGMNVPNPAVSPTVNTTYTLTITSAGCVATVTALATMINTCCPQSATLPVLSSTLLAAGAPTSSLGGPLVLQQDLTISGPGNFTLQTGDFLMNVNVKIILQPGVNLVLSDAHLQSCAYMWQGIQVQNGAKVTSSPGPLGLSTLIEDAVVAIEATSVTTGFANPLLDLSSVIFNKNWYAISVNGSSLSSIPMSIRSCVFTSRNLPFSAPYASPPVWPSASAGVGGLRYATPTALSNSLTPPFAMSNYSLQFAKVNLGMLHGGISVLDVNSGIGGNPATGVDMTAATNPNEFNLFDYLQVGIYARNGNVKTTNNTFQNMGVAGVYGFVNSLVNTRVSLSAASNLKNRFWISNWGQAAYWGGNASWFPSGVALADVLEFDITNALFRGSAMPGNPVGSGIYSNTNRFNNYAINTSTFSSLVYGYNMLMMPAPFNVFGSQWNGVYAGGINILNNFFSPEISTATTGTNNLQNAITLSGPSNWSSAWQVPTMTTCIHTTATVNYVSQNLIDRASQIGISLIGMKCTPLAITQNTISIANGGLFGIEVWQTQANKAIQENSVTVLTTANPQAAAMSFVDNYSMAVNCNTVTNGYSGFRFLGSNPCQWFGNIMRNNHYGLHLAGWMPNYGSWIGAQGNATLASGNQWLGPWGAAGNYETMIEQPTNSFGNELYIDFSSPQSIPLNNGTNSGYNYYTSTMTSTSPFVTLKPSVSFTGCPVIYFGPKSPQGTETAVQSQLADAVDINLYPNPTTGNVTITGEKESEALRINVMDMSGKKIYIKTIRTQDHTYSIDLQFEEGIYLVNITDESNRVAHKKLIISN